jgi:hypothetical protein
MSQSDTDTLLMKLAAGVDANARHDVNLKRKLAAGVDVDMVCDWGLISGWICGVDND